MTDRPPTEEGSCYDDDECHSGCDGACTRSRDRPPKLTTRRDSRTEAANEYGTSSGVSIIDEHDNRWAARSRFGVYGATADEADGNVRRLVAAWNATRHLSIEDLERMAEARWKELKK